MVWLQWATCSGGAGSCGVYRSYQAPEPRKLTPEEEAKLETERLARVEADRIAREKAAAEKAAADRQAKRLLYHTLTHQQRRQYHRTKKFEVTAADGTRFRLTHGWAGNVEELNARGQAINRFCIHPRELVPEADNLVAQKLLLETNPAEFRRIANRTPIAPAVAA